MPAPEEPQPPVPASPYSRWNTPAPLVAAAGLAAIEGGVVVLLAVADAVNVAGDRLTMGITTALFFGLLGVGLVACGWGLNRRRPWARGPVLLTQLIALGLAWSFRGSPTTWIAVVLLIAALVVLAGLLHPASLAALNRPLSGSDEG